MSRRKRQRRDIRRRPGAHGSARHYALPNNEATAWHLIGNAVCPPVATDIINEIRRVA